MSYFLSLKYRSELKTELDKYYITSVQIVTMFGCM